MCRNVAVAGACSLAAALFFTAHVARASAPDVEPEFAIWCMAERTLIASWASPFRIPDFTLDQVDGVVPMSGGADGPLRQLAIELEINHTWIGDLVVRLEYTDCVTGEVLYGTNLICRPRGVDDEGEVPCGTTAGFGCDGNLGRSKLDVPQPDSQRYLFADESTNILDDGACAPVLGSGCYQASPGNLLQGFEGLKRGGCFRMVLSDWKVGDVGTLSSWGVWELNPLAATPSLHASWGRLKTIYR